VIVAFTLSLSMAAQDLPQHQKPSTNASSSSAQPSPDNGNVNPNVKPNPQDTNHNNDALTRSNDQEKDQSAMQKSAPADQKNGTQADNRIKAQTTSQHEVRSSTWGLFWVAVIVAVLLILYASRRPRTRVVIERRQVVDRPRTVVTRDEDIDRVA